MLINTDVEQLIKRKDAFEEVYSILQIFPG